MQLYKQFGCPQTEKVVCVCVQYKGVCGSTAVAQGQIELETHLCKSVTCSQIKQTSIQCASSGKKILWYKVGGWQEKDYLFFKNLPRYIVTL